MMIVLFVLSMYLFYFCVFFFLMIRRPPRSTRTDTLFPYTTLFRSFTVNTLRTVATSCQQMRDHIKTVVFRPDAHKKLDITFGPTQAAALLGRTPEAIAKADAKGRLPPPKQLGNGRRSYMTADLNERPEAPRVGEERESTFRLRW